MFTWDIKSCMNERIALIADCAAHKPLVWSRLEYFSEGYDVWHVRARDAAPAIKSQQAT